MILSYNRRPIGMFPYQNISSAPTRTQRKENGPTSSAHALNSPEGNKIRTGVSQRKSILFEHSAPFRFIIRK